MSLLLITNPPTTFGSNADWVTLLTRSNANMLGHGLSIPIFTLTNWDGSTTIPKIAEGSIIEVGGSFYQADADTALTLEGGITDGTVHIKLVPAGGGASVVPTLTSDAIPAWNANKAGWYDIDDKFLPYEMVKTVAVYTAKSEYLDQNTYVKSVINAGGLQIGGSLDANTINTDNVDLKMKLLSGSANASGFASIAHGVTGANIKGLSTSTESSTNYINISRVNGLNVEIFMQVAASATVTVIVFYV